MSFVVVVRAVVVSGEAIVAGSVEGCDVSTSAMIVLDIKSYCFELWGCD